MVNYRKNNEYKKPTAIQHFFNVLWEEIRWLIKKPKFKFSDWRFNRRMARQRKKKGYSDNMCWGMHDWFTTTFPKMMIELRDMKHGAPEYEFEEFDNFPLQWVEEQSKILLEQKKKKGEDEELDFWGKDKIFDRWWMILSRIAYCLQESDEETCSLQNTYWEEYNRKVWNRGLSDEEIDKMTFKEHWDFYYEVAERDEKGKPLTYKFRDFPEDEDLKKKWMDKEFELSKYRDSMKDEAFDLIKKYFWHLWD